MSILPDVTK